MITGQLHKIRQLFNHRFNPAFSYLFNALDHKSEIHQRIFTSNVGTFRKESLTKEIFALEQVFFTKSRESCFFESHKRYIDMQLVLEGEELMEYTDIDNLSVKQAYNETKDLIIYNDYEDTSKILLKKGDIAIFFPDDAHMGLPLYQKSSKVYKTVIKIPVNYFNG